MASDYCAIEGCGRVVATSGLCQTHYGRLRDGKDVTAPIRHRKDARNRLPCQSRGCDKPAQARGLCSSCYAAAKYRSELGGKPCQATRPENLELWTKPQPNGQRVEDLIRWIVEEYPADVVRILMEGINP